MAKMIKPKKWFYYKDENIHMRANVPVTLQSDEDANKFVEQGLAVDYEEVHPEGELEITTNGQFNVKSYAIATVNVQAIVVTLHGGSNHDEINYMKFILGETKNLPNEEQYLQLFNIEEDKYFAGWTTTANDVNTKVEGALTPNQDMHVYALILENSEVEEEEINTGMDNHD